MSDLEAALAAHLNGKFFWEHTNNLDDTDKPREALEIVRAQREFAKGAKNITSRNKDFVEPKKSKPRGVTLPEDQKLIEPVLNAVSSVYEVDAKDILGCSTSQKFAKAKAHFYWAMFRYMPGLSLKELGRIMVKCHTTIKHGRDMFEASQDFEKVVEVDRLMGHNNA